MLYDKTWTQFEACPFEYDESREAEGKLVSTIRNRCIFNVNKAALLLLSGLEQVEVSVDLHIKMVDVSFYEFQHIPMHLADVGSICGI